MFALKDVPLNINVIRYYRKYICLDQGWKQEFFRAGKVFWNKGTSINISFTTHERKALQGKISEFFLLVHALKTAF